MSPVAAYESKAYSESVWAELSDTTLLAAWKDVFSDTLPACEDKMLKTVDVGTGLGWDSTSNDSISAVTDTFDLGFSPIENFQLEPSPSVLCR